MTQVLIAQVEFDEMETKMCPDFSLQGCHYSLVCRINAEQDQCGERSPEQPV
jgi:hypothetical protein